MINDSKSILKIVSDFKANKWSTSKIEIDLEISNGLLGKAAKGKTKLSEEKFNKLEAYHIKHFVTAMHPLKEVKNSLGNLSDKVTTADKIPENPFVKVVNGEVTSITVTDRNIGSGYSLPKWFSEIETYCGELGILPNDLIETHRQSLKKPKKGLANDLGDRNFDKTNHSKFRSDLIKAKTGYSPKE